VADRDRLIAAIDEMHELTWARGESGHGAARRTADELARALGWQGDDGTTPDGQWLREQLGEVLR
jgi:hypothetical protein